VITTISGTVDASNCRIESTLRAVAEIEITVTNINPKFQSNDALKEKKKEVSQALFGVFSKY